MTLWPVQLPFSTGTPGSLIGCALGANNRCLCSRQRGAPAAELGLFDIEIGDDRILEAMVVHPILVNRPIVVMRKGIKLYRPSMVVLDLLESKPTSL